MINGDDAQARDGQEPSDVPNATDDGALDDLLAFARGNGRVCPQPQRWDDLWKMLPNRRRVGRGWMPPIPLILGGWWASSDLDKRHRLEVHLRHAAEHGALDAVDGYLLALPERDWHHQDQAG